MQEHWKKLEKEIGTAAVAEDWDNVGLLTGDEESEVKHVFLLPLRLPKQC